MTPVTLFVKANSSQISWLHFYGLPSSITETTATDTLSALRLAKKNMLACQGEDILQKTFQTK